MHNKTEASFILRKAKGLIDSRAVGGDLEHRLGELAQPVPIVDHSGRVIGWFVAISIDTLIVGFIQFDAQGVLLRYSTFRRLPESLEGCPGAAAWLDVDQIGQRAAEHISGGRVVGAPVLTFDEHITKLVWAAKVRDARGCDVTVYVAGEYSYTASRQ